MADWVHSKAEPGTPDPNPTDGRTHSPFLPILPTWDELMVFLFMGNHWLITEQNRTNPGASLIT